MESSLVLVLLAALLAIPAGLVALALWSFRQRVEARSREEAVGAELIRLRTGLEALHRRLIRLEEAGGRPSEPVRPAETAEVPEPASPSAPVPGAVPPASPAPPAPFAGPTRPAAPRASSEPARPRWPVPRPGPAQPVPPPARPAELLFARRESTESEAGGGLERELATRVAVWIGAVALALAGALFVKWSFDRGLLGPTMRVVLGVAFGAGLVGFGEWLRSRSAGVAQGLVASGIATLFAALLAGTSLYGIIARPVGFLLLAATTAAAVLLALRHGPLIALLGLFGGFLTPALIGAEEPNPWNLFGYLFLLVGGLLAVSRRRGWWPIAALTLAGALVWSLAAVLDADRFGLTSTAPVGAFVLATIGAMVLMAFSTQWEDPRIPLGLVWAAAGCGIPLLALTASVAGFGTAEWGYFAILAAGCLALGWRDESFEGLPWASSVVGAALLAVWGRQADPSLQRVWWTALALGLLHLCGAYAISWSAQAADRWAALAAASGLVWFLAAYSTSPDAAWPLPWAVQSVAGAVLFAFLAVPAFRRRTERPRGDGALAALAVAATAFVSLAVPLQFERQWLTVAWALEIPALVWIAWRLSVPFLDRMAWALAGFVAVRLLFNPAVLFDYPIGTSTPFNWLLFGYGIPALAFLAASAVCRRAAVAELSEALEAGGLVFALALGTLEVRQYFHAGSLGAREFAFAEWGALSVVWLLFGIALVAAHDLTGRRVHAWTGTTAGLGGLGIVLIGAGILDNPLQVAHDVGATPIFNRLLGVYALPALLAGFFARQLRPRQRELSIVPAAAALTLVFAFVSLSVRQAFHGGDLTSGATTSAEQYAYSAAWILLATVLLVVGIATKGPVIRTASAAIMTAAVLKVFLYDTAQLRDLYRVFSLLGLGASLMLLAFLYQRFVFGDREGGKPARRSTPASPAGPETPHVAAPVAPRQPEASG